MGFLFLILEILLCVVVGWLTASGKLEFGWIAGALILSQVITHQYYLFGIGLSATATFGVVFASGLIAIIGSYYYFKYFRHKTTRRRH